MQSELVLITLKQWSLIILYNLFLFSILSTLSFGKPLIKSDVYPFNYSKQSIITCYSNTLSSVNYMQLTAVTGKWEVDKKFQINEVNVKANGSIKLIIHQKFNYSTLIQPVECEVKYLNNSVISSYLNVYHVVEIPQKAFFSIIIDTGKSITISCITYGTNVSLLWDFSKDGKSYRTNLPDGVQFRPKYIVNDALYIEKVSYDIYRGYYRCNGSNIIENKINKDFVNNFLRVRKNGTWIPILIALLCICACVATLILYSEYYQPKTNVTGINNTKESVVYETEKQSMNCHSDKEVQLPPDLNVSIKRQSNIVSNIYDYSNKPSKKFPSPTVELKQSSVSELFEKDADESRRKIDHQQQQPPSKLRHPATKTPLYNVVDGSIKNSDIRHRLTITDDDILLESNSSFLDQSQQFPLVSSILSDKTTFARRSNPSTASHPLTFILGNPFTSSNVRPIDTHVNRRRLTNNPSY
ncbi:unnamed protein product [Didymodactylos carnosus]|uniref:Ig-like domain-containing protein n=1 Tax=Didymodactylos carnosus TaxID=1234261 RepID=A0A814AS65_9BILA|nr:unnamed protein product [Didymodactylos carnosus]CAF0973352.1 unnamed protein product [Didymodactylos carnosus]CAF3698703.1 unnamed protein product [Didymodactylos carnosus]CAF3744503.1 unnamed protein product [Didymodactylos carnosus]